MDRDTFFNRAKQKDASAKTAKQKDAKAKAKAQIPSLLTGISRDEGAAANRVAPGHDVE